MKRISVYNNRSHNQKSRRNKIIQLLKEYGFSPMAKGEIVIVLGGDGTFLSSLREHRKDNPIFVGLNSGNLGYFSEFDFNEARKLMKVISDKKYRVEEYPIYEFEVVEKNGYTHRDIFVNDLAIKQEGGEKAIHLSTKVNDIVVPIAGDGVVVSSTLGSTAYNMSLGGAVFLDHIPTLQISSIAQMFNKVYTGPRNSLVVNDDSFIEIRPSHKKKRLISVICDNKKIRARNIKAIRISKSKDTFRVLRTDDFNYGKHIQNKLF